MKKLVIKKGELNYDSTGRAYPDNPENKKNWKCIWVNDNKYYRLVDLPYHADWEEVGNPIDLLV